ncbi:hypothetical protein Angca_005259 [Angiostrongylus cantonensis]|nr:hypothetical protein Angca_005259 [Angiostrongylus cantonensis]
MSGRGKRGKGQGEEGAKWHREVLKNSIQRMAKQAIRRLARRAGVMPISGLTCEEIREVLKVLLNNVIRVAMIYCVQARRKTVLAVDVGCALKRRGLTLSRFGG